MLIPCIPKLCGLRYSGGAFCGKVSYPRLLQIANYRCKLHQNLIKNSFGQSFQKPYSNVSLKSNGYM